MKKIKHSLLVGALTLILVGAGCSRTAAPSGETGSTDDSNSVATNGGSCGAFRVTVDGEDVSGEFDNGIAYTGVNMGYRTEIVDLFNHSKVSCEDVLPKYRPTSIPTDEVAARAFFGDYPGVALGAHTELPMGANITVSKQPAGVGSTMTVCVNDPIEFTATAGTYAGKKVVMSGSFSGEYCGDKTEN